VSVCVSENVYCDKTADCIQMPFGVMSEVGQEMGVLDGDGDRYKRGLGQYWW